MQEFDLYLRQFQSPGIPRLGYSTGGVMVLFIQYLILLANFSKKCSLACTLGLAKIVVRLTLCEKIHIVLLVKFFASDFY